MQGLQPAAPKCPHCLVAMAIYPEVERCNLCGYEKRLSNRPIILLWLPPTGKPTVFEKRIDSRMDSAKTSLPAPPESHKEPAVLLAEPVPSTVASTITKDGSPTARKARAQGVWRRGRGKSDLNVTLYGMLSKRPWLKDREVLRELDGDGAMLPKRMNRHQTFESAYSDPEFTNALASRISKVRQKVRNREPL